MATVTKTIGTTSRDYSTPQAWEDDLDNGAIYASGDNAVGQMWNDSSFTAAVAINGGATIGLATVRLTVESTQRHDGTAGTGVRFVGAGNNSISLNPPAGGNGTLICEWVEVNGNDAGINTAISCIGDSGEYPTVRYCIVHDAVGNSSLSPAINTSSRDARIIRNIVYNWNHSVNGRSCVGIVSLGQATGVCIGNTVWNITGVGVGTGKGIDVGGDASGYICKNNISMGNSSFDFEFAGTTNGAYGTNMSEDTTATGGSGNITSAVVADQFVSTVAGSEDLHLKSGADAIDAGEDLGAISIPGMEIDIDGRDTDAEGDTWDIGADEFVVVGGGGSQIKTINGLAIASVKTINGLAIASVKKRNGLTNV